MKKKIILVVSFLSIIIAILIAVLMFSPKKSETFKIDDYNKYRYTITISTSKANQEENYKIYGEYDLKVNQIVFTEIEGILLNYKDAIINIRDYDDVYESFATPYSYDKLYALFKKASNFKLENEYSGKMKYSSRISSKIMKEILNNLYVNIDVNQKEYSCEMLLKDNKINNVSFSIKDASGYDVIYISIDYEELDDNYTIDISKYNFEDNGDIFVEDSDEIKIIEKKDISNNPLQFVR